MPEREEVVDVDLDGMCGTREQAACLEARAGFEHGAPQETDRPHPDDGTRG